jgi:hypothetical protein
VGVFLPAVPLMFPQTWSGGMRVSTLNGFDRSSQWTADGWGVCSVQQLSRVKKQLLRLRQCQKVVPCDGRDSRLSLQKLRARAEDATIPGDSNTPRSQCTRMSTRASSHLISSRLVSSRLVSTHLPSTRLDLRFVSTESNPFSKDMFPLQHLESARVAAPCGRQKGRISPGGDLGPAC